MKTLTLHQPWASLIALLIKMIETRSWPTKFRGRLGLHAGLTVASYEDASAAWDECARVLGYGPVYMSIKGREPGWVLRKATKTQQEIHGVRPLSLGAVLATCTLTDCVPIAAEGQLERTPGLVSGWSDRRQVQTLLSYDRLGPSDTLVDDHSGQVPYGDFSPDRWAWMLEDVRPLAEPVPCKGRQGLWNWEEAA